MVVLSAAITTKSGRPLVARQFVDISRVRIEGLLAAFPKLMGSEKQHTFIETENVRYVYQPMENLYLLIVTTKASNIVEDLDTLQLLSKLVPEYARSLDEDEICKVAFELVFAFDEVITMGYKEKASLQMVKTFTEMDSHEERIQEMIEKNKMKEVKAQAKKREKEIEAAKAEREKAGIRAPSGFGGGGGFGAGGGGPSDFGGSSGSMSASASTPTASSITKEAASPKESAPGRGMKLKKSNKTNKNLMQALKDEGVAVDDSLGADAASAAIGAGAAATPAAPANTSPVQFRVSEAVSVSVNNDGGLEHMEIKGDLSLKVVDANFAKFAVQLAMGENKRFQFKTHPNIDKGAFAESATIALKDRSRAFPLNTPLGVLKWRFTSTDEDDVPLTVNCWPSPVADGVEVNIEYELTKDTELEMVTIAIPVPGASSAPVIGDGAGDHKYDPKAGILYWNIPFINSSENSGSLEFTVSGVQPSDFLPINVRFQAPKPFCDVAVSTVMSPDDEEVPCSYMVSSVTDTYEVI